MIKLSLAILAHSGLLWWLTTKDTRRALWSHPACLLYALAAIWWWHDIMQRLLFATLATTHHEANTKLALLTTASCLWASYRILTNPDS